MHKPEAVIVDIDGTVAVYTDAKMKLVQEENWEAYTEACKTDPLFEYAAAILDGLSSVGVRIIYVTARQEIMREVTENWLAKHDLDFGAYELYMRPGPEKIPDEKIKSDIYEKYLKDKFNILCVFEDRKPVVDMWREKGLICLQVADEP